MEWLVAIPEKKKKKMMMMMKKEAERDVDVSKRV
jgi:hypothetical protein